MQIQTTPGPWPKNPAVYEINTRIWLAELSKRTGKMLSLDQVPDEELERIAQQGFHGVWLMGVWTTGTEAIAIARTQTDLQEEYQRALPDVAPEDIIGSPYAITTYRVSPLLGGPPALVNLRQRLAKHGLRLILDFVCNHTSRDHKLVYEHPEVFVSGTPADLEREPRNYFKTSTGVILAHGRDPYFPGWSDTAQINYAQRPGREAMKGKLEYIASQCDGVRCDMAMLILPEILERVWDGRLGPEPNRASFWKEAIADTLALNPNFLFLAESYWGLEWKLQQEGFHFTYDKTLYDRLREHDFRNVRQHLHADKVFQEHCARFIENHDEPRAATAFGAARSRSAAVATFFCPGFKLLHEGQLQGWRVKIPVQLGRRPQEKEDVEIALFYDKILPVLSDPIFQDGTFSICDVNSSGWGDASNDSLLAYLWEPPASRATRCTAFLVAVNLGDNRAFGRVPIPARVLGDCKQLVLNDRYDGKRYEREAEELKWPGLYVALEGHSPHLFEISGK